MTLLSLTFGKVTFDTKQDKYLEINLPAVAMETTWVRGRGVPERLYYRLDVELAPGQSAFRLPLADVVARRNISPGQLGIYAERKLQGGQNAFIPANARVSRAPPSDDIIAIIRPGADVTDVQWRTYSPGIPPTAWVSVAGASGLVPEGTRLEIMLKKDMPLQMTLEVSFRSSGIDRAERFAILAH